MRYIIGDTTGFTLFISLGMVMSALVGYPRCGLFGMVLGAPVRYRLGN